MPESIAISRFAELLEQADRAAKSGNLVDLLAISKEIGKVGYALLIRDGELYVQQFVPESKPKRKDGV